MTHAIEWCTHTENPITGCRHGCPWCYARRMAHRLGANPSPGAAPYRAAAVYGGDPFSPSLHLYVLDAMRLRLRRARRDRVVFLGSMADVCSRGPWAVLAGDHLVATWSSAQVQGLIAGTCGELSEHLFLILTKAPMGLIPCWPRNVGVGVSCTDSRMARDNVAALLAAAPPIPGALRWASVEPLQDPDFDPALLEGLDWVVVGAETGPGAPRSAEATAGVLRAARRIVEWGDRCRVPVFVKRNLRRLDVPAFWPMRSVPWRSDPCR